MDARLVTEHARIRMQQRGIPRLAMDMGRKTGIGGSR